MPADVPSVNPSVVEKLLDAHARPRAVTVVAAARDGGTNALLCSPPDVIPNCFGHNSFRAHCQLAASSGIEPTILSLSGLQYDIDRPLDLQSFLNSPGTTKTYAYLTNSGIARRLLESSAFSAPEASLSSSGTEPATTRLHKG